MSHKQASHIVLFLRMIVKKEACYTRELLGQHWYPEVASTKKINDVPVAVNVST